MIRWHGNHARHHQSVWIIASKPHLISSWALTPHSTHSCTFQKITSTFSIMFFFLQMRVCCRPSTDNWENMCFQSHAGTVICLRHMSLSSFLLSFSNLVVFLYLFRSLPCCCLALTLPPSFSNFYNNSGHNKVIMITKSHECILISSIRMA